MTCALLLPLLLAAPPQAAQAQALRPAPAGRPLERHLRALAKRLPAGFTVVVEPPFVVVGDGPADRVRHRAQHTVRWATRKLKKAYGFRDPDHIIDIWLFQNERSYRKYTRALFGDNPDTPYGYYSPSDRALIMNIGTGGGTLVHELVHPLVAASFPACPAWFNEGLGSLYEQAAERDGHIVGLTNWRLSGLQEAIRRGRTRTFESLLSTSDAEFYGDDSGSNYAQARYLLYYLQERGLLHEFYRTFYAHRRADPTGYETLKRVLGHPDMREFQKRQEAYVMKLRR